MQVYPSEQKKWREEIESEYYFQVSQLGFKFNAEMKEQTDELLNYLSKKECPSLRSIIVNFDYNYKYNLMVARLIIVYKTGLIVHEQKYLGIGKENARYVFKAH